MTFFLAFGYFAFAITNQTTKLIIPPPSKIFASFLSFAQPTQKYFINKVSQKSTFEQLEKNISDVKHFLKMYSVIPNFTSATDPVGVRGGETLKS